MKYNKTSFPVQKLPKAKKTDEWAESCVDYIISMGEVVSGGMTRTRFEELQVYYNLYNSIFDEKDLKYVTNPYKVDDGFPASPQDMNIIRPKIDLLLGEETKRPFNFNVMRTSQIASGELQDKAKQLLMQYMMAAVTANMSEEEQIKFQQGLQSGEIQTPEQIQKYITSEYKDVTESTAYHTLNYLRNKLLLDHEFNKGWKDALIAGEEVYYVGILNGEPHMERVNPIFFSYDKSPDLEFIEDGDWACRRMRLSYTEVYDRFYDKMTDKQLDELLDLVDGKPGSYGADKNMIDDFNKYRVRITDNPTYDFRSRNTINVWHSTWKSFKKVAFVTYADENGEVQETMVDEDYIKTGLEIDIKWDWILEVWEGYRVGHDLYISMGPIQYQHVSIDNPNSQKLPYTGVIYSNTNSVPKSLVSIMKPLQYMYIILWYRLELALSRDKGKVINMDITQIPKSMNITPERWMHYLSAVGVNFINPYEEGWDIPGREGGKPAQFNQITALDLTMSNVIAQYIQLMDKIEQMLGTLSGITQQREGAISSSELVGNVERSVVQSSMITEPLFWLHNQCKRRSLQLLLNTAKSAWAQSGKKKLHYVFDDATRAFMDISDEFYYDDFDIFISDSSKEAKNIESLRQLIQPAMQNGASLLDVVDIISTDNFNMIKKKLGEIEEKRMQQQEQAAQSENDRQAQLIQMQNQYKELEMQFKQQELELQKYKIDTEAETRLSVAEISAFGFAQNSENPATDAVDQTADLALRDRELAAKEMDMQMNQTQKQTELMHKREVEHKKINAQKEIDNKKIDLEKQKMSLEEKKLNAAKELQRIKDTAAMEREKLKAKTAIRNKVSGQK